MRSGEVRGEPKPKKEEEEVVGEGRGSTFGKVGKEGGLKNNEMRRRGEVGSVVGSEIGRSERRSGWDEEEDGRGRHAAYIRARHEQGESILHFGIKGEM